uniref:Uncharacterized protein n=1 Tax=Leersia perrieri TaxID=77586 RepID=A0A0D9XD90_9ORYZ
MAWPRVASKARHRRQGKAILFLCSSPPPVCQPYDTGQHSCYAFLASCCCQKQEGRKQRATDARDAES